MTDTDMFSRMIGVGLVCGVLYLLPFLLFFSCITSITKVILLMLMMMLILCLIMMRPANWLCNAGNRSQPATNSNSIVKLGSWSWSGPGPDLV